MTFQTKIVRARFVYSPFSAEEMNQIGDRVLASIKERIRRGENCEDSPARPLKKGRNGRRGYPDYKAARGLQPIRDWTWRGKTLRALKVKSASENRVVIGFIDDESDRIAHANNRREKQFGVSPKDREALGAAVLEVVMNRRPVQFKRVA